MHLHLVFGIITALSQTAIFLSIISAWGTWPAVASVVASFVLFSVFRLAHYSESKSGLAGAVFRWIVPFNPPIMLCHSFFLASFALLIPFETWRDAALYGGVTSVLYCQTWAPTFRTACTSRRPMDGSVAACVIALVTFAVMLPALGLVQPLTGHDAIHHTKWQAHFADQFWSGELYPRWLQDMNGGLGSPVFFIYPPLSHHITSLLYPFSPGDAGVQIRLAQSIALSLFVGGIGFYIWIRDMGLSWGISLFGALIYTIAPYHLAIDVFIRTSFAEVWTMAWIPFAMWGINNFPRGSGFLVFTCALTANIVTHSATSVLILPLYSAYQLFLTISRYSLKETEFWTENIKFAVSVLLSLMIASPYLAVAMANMENIDLNALSGGYFDVRTWFLNDLGGDINPGVLFTVPPVFAFQTLGTFFLIGFLVFVGISGPLRAQMWFALALTLVCLVLNTSLSRPFWDLETIFNRIQFPWRLLTLQTLAFAIVFTLSMHQISLRAGRIVKTGLAVLALIGVVLPNVALYSAKTIAAYRDGLSPPTVGELLVDSQDVPEYRMGDQTLAEPLFGGSQQQIKLLEGEGDAELLETSPKRVIVGVRTETEAELALRRYIYPGWQARLHRTGKELDIEAYSPALPVIKTRVPQGEHKVEFELQESTLERWTPFLAVCGIILLLGFTVLIRKQNAKPAM